jgi:hypothetical protein
LKRLPNSSAVTPVPSFSAENTNLLRSTSSSPALDGFIVNVATSLEDLRRTVFLALELTSSVP